MTTFGTQVLLPFSGARIALPAMFIVDPLLTLPLLLLLCRALRLPPEHMPRPPAGNPFSPGRGSALYSAESRRLARTGLAWVILYPLACLGVNAAAAALLEPSLAPPSPPFFSGANADHAHTLAGDDDAAPRFARQRLQLLTEPFSPFFWKAVVDEGPSYRISTLFLFNPGRERLEHRFAKPEPEVYAHLQRQLPLFSWFEDFSPLLTQTTRPANALVQAEHGQMVFECAFVDVRYLISPESPARWVGRDDPNFVLEARITSRGGLLAYRLLQRGIAVDTPWISVE
jgi:inner membrane protein